MLSSQGEPIDTAPISGSPSRGSIHSLLPLLRHLCVIYSSSPASKLVLFFDIPGGGKAISKRVSTILDN
jgi:hypothetical protein